MNFQPPRRASRTPGAVEITPLIDVVFLLLIFFMVSTTFVRETALGIELPTARGAAESPEPTDVAVTISAAGEVAVNGRVLADARPETLTAALRERSGERVVLAADAAARHAAVVRVLDAAQRAGLTQIRLLAERLPQEADGRP